jgi:hypothetical protein
MVRRAAAHAPSVAPPRAPAALTRTRRRCPRNSDAGFARLLRASDGARVVGWFVARRGTPLLPSQRETAVWRALQRRAADGAGPAPLFAIISGEQPEAGEPFSSQFLFLAAPACLPLAVRVLNYGAAAPPRARADAPAAPRWHPLLDGDGDAAASWRALEATAVANAATARSTLEAALGRAALLCQDVERADDVLQARLAELRLQREAALEALEPCHSEVGTSGEELSAADEAEAEAAELLDDAPLVLAQPGPDDPPLAYTPPQLVPDAPAAGEERGTRTMPEDAHTLAWN